jgi:glycosyltransferase involved in cell wall biosynthesis
MHVVYLVSSAQLGGTEASVFEMIGSLREAHPDWSFRVVTPADGPFVARLQAAGTTVHVLPFPAALARLGEAGRMASVPGRVRFAFAFLRAALPAVFYSRRLKRTLASEGPVSVVHAHGFKMQVLAVRALPPGAALVWHVHDYVSPRRLSAHLLRLFAPQCTVIIVNSMSVAADVRRVCGPAVRVETVYNAVDLRRFSPEGPAIDLDALGGAAPAAPRTIRVGLLGTFGRWKGHRVFLRALAALPRELGIRGYIIGGPQYQTAGSQETEASLRRVAGELGLADTVVFTGPVDEPARALRALDIVVHASTEPEPFGMVIAEGMACGRPVVFALAGGTPEIVQDGVDALGHTPGDASELADRLRQLAADPALRERLGLEARRSAERRFDRSRLAIELTPLYAALMA